MDTGYIHQLAEQIHQAGRDEMAETLASMLNRTVGADELPDGYRDGVEDALLTLIKADATDPR